MATPPLPRPTIGVSAIVFDGSGRVLLVQRGQPPAQGFWHAPGGKLEPGESLLEGCCREVREETGLEIVPGPIMAVVERRVEGFHYLIVDFLASLQDPQQSSCRPADDALDVAWIAPEGLQDYPIAEGLLPILETARRAWRGEPIGLHDRLGTGTDFLSMS